MEKVDKYQDLALELQRLWRMKVSVVPVVTGVLGVVSNNLRHWLAVLEVDTRTCLRQKGAYLDSKHLAEGPSIYKACWMRLEFNKDTKTADEIIVIELIIITIIIIIIVINKDFK